MLNRNLIITIILTIITSFSICQQSFAISNKPIIVTTITPIASLVASLTKDKAEIKIFNKSSGCPHHHNIRPSDKDFFDNAGVIIYIDQDFEQLPQTVLESSKAIKIKISDFSNINFRVKPGDKINWHFWLDLKNILVLQNELALKLMVIFPEMAGTIKKNLPIMTSQIMELEKLKNKTLKNMSGLAVLSDSLEHFFQNLHNDEGIKFFNLNNNSLKNMRKLDTGLKTNSTECIVLSTDQNYDAYTKYGKKIVQPDSENWQLPHDYSSLLLEELFYTKYSNMIYEVAQCLLKELD